MAVYDTTNNVNTSILFKNKLSKNFEEDNQWIESYQNKVNKDWEYATNVVDIKESLDIYDDNGYIKALPTYKDIEVRITSAQNEKGQKLSDDWKNIIFKDVQHELNLGRKYSFDVNDFKQTDEKKKCTWIAVNYDTVKLGKNTIIRRCNNKIGFLINNNSEEYYEPIILDYDSKYTINYFNNQLNVVKSEVQVTVQFNEFTKDIKVNDRFVVGALDFNNIENNSVYKVKEAFKLGSKYTEDPNAIPLIILALDRDVINTETDYVAKDTDGTIHFIADYKIKKKEKQSNKTQDKKYYLKISQGKYIVRQGETETFKCNLYDENDNVVISEINQEFKLGECPRPELYFKADKITDNTFYISNLKKYFRYKLTVTCTSDSLQEAAPLKVEIQLGESL